MPLPAGLLLLCCAALAGCSTVTDATRRAANAIVPYRVEIVQGNFISSEQVDALKVGMSRAEVRDVLGTPLLQSVFHADRWDYVFTMRRQGTDPQARQLTVFFKDDLLERVQGDPMPSEAEFVALLGAERKIKDVPVLEASEEKLKSLAPREPQPADAPAAAQPPLPASYPPLEPPAR
ncbi:MAG: outer membrane protein assembly factor BamE [Pseudorhodoferax sp.]